MRRLPDNGKVSTKTEGGLEHLCTLFDQSPESPGVAFQISGEIAVAWEIAGAGTADIFESQSDNTIRIIRAWVTTESMDILTALAEADSRNQTLVGTIRVPTKCLAIFWAPESGKQIPERVESDVQEVREAAIAKSSYVMRVKSEIYACTHDEVEIGNNQARRLTLTPI